MRKFVLKILKVLGIFVSLVIMALAFYYSVMYGIKIMSYRHEVETPDIKGAKVRDALRILQKKRLGMVLLEERFSEVVPKGRIINQFPASGIRLKVDSTIRVIISKGKESLKVPDLVGKSLNSGELTLDSFSLQRGDIAYAHSSSMKKDHIIAQNPRAGDSVFKGDEVDLLVSLGPDEKLFVMPDLIGKDINVALSKLKISHLPLNRIIYKFDDAYAENLVINQSPELGYPVSDAMGVTLMVNREIVKEKDKLRFVIFRYVLPRGYEKRKLELILVNNIIKRRTLKKSIYPPGYYFKYLVVAPPGSDVELLIDGKIVKRLQIK